MSDIVRQAVASGRQDCPAAVMYGRCVQRLEVPCFQCKYSEAWRSAEELIPRGSLVTEYADGTVTVEVPK